MKTKAQILHQLMVAFALPTWILYRAFRPFLRKDHPLRKRISLYDWWKHETTLCRIFDLLFMSHGFALLIFFLRIIYGHTPMGH